MGSIRAKTKSSLPWSILTFLRSIPLRMKDQKRLECLPTKKHEIVTFLKRIIRFFDIVGSGNRENQREVDAKNCRGALGSNQEVEAPQGGFETRQLFDRSPGRVEDDEIRQENGAGLEERRIFNAFLGPADQDRSYQEPCNQFTNHSRVGETESLILETPAPPVQRDPIVNAVQASRRIQEPSRKSRVQKHLDHFVDAQEVEASQGGLETRELFDRSPRRVEDDEIRQENGAGLEEWQISNAFLGPADQDRSYQEPCHQFTNHSRPKQLRHPEESRSLQGNQEPKKQLDLFGEAQDRSYQEPSHQFTENSNMGERDSPHFEMPATLAHAVQASRGIQEPPKKSTAQKYLDPFGEPRASRAADSQLFSSLDAYAGGRNRFSPKSSQIYSRSNHEKNGLSEPRNRQDALESRRLSKEIQDSRVEMQDSLPRPLQEIRRSSFLDCLEADEQIRSVAPAMQGMADIPCSRAAVPSDARVLRSFGYLLARFAGELGISQTTARPSQEMNTGKFFDSPREENHEPMMNITENRGDHNKNQKLARKSAENFHPERQPVSINDREGRNSEFSNQNVRTGNPSDIFAGTSLTSRGLQRSRSASRAPRIKGFADPDDIYRKLDSRGSDPFETFQTDSPKIGSAVLEIQRLEGDTQDPAVLPGEGSPRRREAAPPRRAPSAAAAPQSRLWPPTVAEPPGSRDPSPGNHRIHPHCHPDCGRGLRNDDSNNCDQLSDILVRTSEEKILGSKRAERDVNWVFRGSCETTIPETEPLLTKPRLAKPLSKKPRLTKPRLTKTRLTKNGLMKPGSTKPRLTKPRSTEKKNNALIPTAIFTNPDHISF
ncbi:unnamed protein product [Nesidiocoris tenuis]|uniref:Uncharacterized protein n=1 Tax=Nesidiocoris tenuis TaxID=355587 RepID=A0A6H5G4T5_9HEMI|nr:unnamed protein product [Nesidiocoris tenuis]